MTQKKCTQVVHVMLSTNMQLWVSNHWLPCLCVCVCLCLCVGVCRAAEASQDVESLRPPRFIHDDGVIRPYREREGLGSQMLQVSVLTKLHEHTNRHEHTHTHMHTCIHLYVHQVQYYTPYHHTTYVCLIPAALVQSCFSSASVVLQSCFSPASVVLQ